MYFIDYNIAVECDELHHMSETNKTKIDILVNSAAVAIFGPVATMSSDDWTRTIDVNLTGVFLTCQAFHPLS